MRRISPEGNLEKIRQLMQLFSPVEDLDGDICCGFSDITGEILAGQKKRQGTNLLSQPSMRSLPAPHTELTKL
jgi:hypothetical protein